MTGKKQDKGERELFRPRLEDFINPHHALALPAKKIDWTYFENEFATSRRSRHTNKCVNGSTSPKRQISTTLTNNKSNRYNSKSIMDPEKI
ncbi:MAG: hypothetical protein LBT24_02260 [Tannerella sp.]|jgi:hypothetical protein|nr:hypothetical protein [Tannerella sp.]